jgi:lysophospholipase L1-like esterase
MPLILCRMIPPVIPASVRIMPLGDSITQGQNTSYGSYRRLLYSELIADGIDVDFVGSLSDGIFPDPDHEGHTGEDIISIWARIQTAGILLTYAPVDIILLLIGTNDIWHGADPSPSAALTMLDNLLTSIPAYGGASTKVIVGSIPPIDVSVAGSTVSSNVDVYNAGIPALVASKGANFFFVDTNAALTTADLADGVHPTDAGNDKLAPVWRAGIQAALGAGPVGYLLGGGVILTSDSGDQLRAR